MAGQTSPWHGMAGLVEAPPDGVWRALLETLPYLQGQPRETSLNSTAVTKLTVPLTAAGSTMDSAEVGRLHLEIDGAARQLSMAGEWWYRGVYTVRAREHGSEAELRYDIYNQAPGATRWIVPLIQRDVRGLTRATLTQQLTGIGKLLNCRTRLLDD